MCWTRSAKLDRRAMNPRKGQRRRFALSGAKRRRFLLRAFLADKSVVIEFPSISDDYGTRMKNLIFLVSCLLLWRHCHGLLCYRCDGLNKPVSDCPGWHRRPVDSLRDLGDRGGLYTHCVDIRLANGTVLYQDMHPAMPTCVGNFLSVWREQLVKDYKMDVSVICCEWNRCNGPNAMAAAVKHDFFLLVSSALAVIIWTRNLLAGNS